MNKEGLSRRQKVALEDAKTALELSLISPIEESTSVTFRHLALLAQTKSNDGDVWNSIGIEEPIPQSMVDRLQRMRTWIDSRHFPDELRIAILTDPDTKAVALLDEDNLKLLPKLIDAFRTCEWDAEAIQTCISSTSKGLDMSPRHAYRALYLCIMGAERGPRLPTILAELNRDSIVALLNACISLKQEP